MEKYYELISKSLKDSPLVHEFVPKEVVDMTKLPTLAAKSQFVEELIKKDLLAYSMKMLGEGMCMYFSRNLLWYEYEANDKEYQCGVCKIKLLNGDKCGISDCEHKFHADCIARYYDRVENKCPICQTEIQDKLAKFDDFDENIFNLLREKINSHFI
jgi:hypothetical protein